MLSIKYKGSLLSTCAPTQKKINNERQELVDELDKLLDNNENQAQNLEAMEELHN